MSAPLEIVHSQKLGSAGCTRVPHAGVEGPRRAKARHQRSRWRSTPRSGDRDGFRPREGPACAPRGLAPTTLRAGDALERRGAELDARSLRRGAALVDGLAEGGQALAVDVGLAQPRLDRA